MAAVKLVVTGAGGRMGAALINAIEAVSGAELYGALEREGSPHLGKDASVVSGLEPSGVIITTDIDSTLSGADVILDFTTPMASVHFAQKAAEHGVAHVVGTTGLEADENLKIEQSAQKTAIVKSGNMSLGVNLLGQLVRQAAQALDADFDIEIIEMHHRHKVDAPSGTALLLANEAAIGRDIDLDANSVRVRDGYTGARKRGDIGFATLRGGSVIGEHSVIFAAEGERIELSHIAQDRSIFARGAVKAALWAKGREPGLYSMLDVLGITN
ncbi:MAG: 4-hydroxy-tetrahydrodipicolinate reductase [Cohaesibacteraceae bacterium]|nr:4-hydroxy-tetrahydrodipicolinate reductase [Cohaesibacteraceae bacterium]MBL4875897.1 4-hydroxy-tetrahydrodipicolinate reductase [Cohaesibacteraceae bacterium]